MIVKVSSKILIFILNKESSIILLFNANVNLSYNFIIYIPNIPSFEIENKYANFLLLIIY